MSKKQKKLIKLSIILSAIFAITPVANAMHIMEGYLPPAYCIAWGIVSLPFVVYGVISINNKVKENRRSITMFAMAGAFIFVISSLKIPSVTGSSSHMTGTGLGAILLGPSAVCVLGLIVLIFQAILLAHGGITTLGANIFSMSIAGPIVAFGIYKLCGMFKVNKRIAIFLAAMLGDLFTYIVTSIQLGLAYPASEGGVLTSTLKFMAVFAPTQLPLAVIEGMLTVIMVMALDTYARPELTAIGYIREDTNEQKG